MKAVELIPAFEWQCDYCGVRNFASGVVLSPEQLEEFVDPIKRIDVGEMEGCWMQKPGKVTCRACGEQFETEEMGP